MPALKYALAPPEWHIMQRELTGDRNKTLTIAIFGGYNRVEPDPATLLPTGRAAMKDRYEQEIEQLLSELDSETADPVNRPPSADAPRPLDDEPSPFTPKPKASVQLISPNKLALIGAVLAVAGLLPVLPVFTSLAGLGIMIIAAVWMFVRRMGSQSQSYWRGRPVEKPPQGAWERFRHWLSR